VAAREAIEAAQLKDVDPYTVGVVFASGMGGLEYLESQIVTCTQRDKEQFRLSLFQLPSLT